MGGLAGFNEPIESLLTAESQHEMREFNVLENDLEMEDLASHFQRAGFEEPVFKVAASPITFLSHSEWRECIFGTTQRACGIPSPIFSRTAGFSISRKASR